MCSKKDRLDGGKVQQISPFLFVSLYVSQFVLSNKKAKKTVVKIVLKWFT